MPRGQVLIVGAGIAGLSAAFFARQRHYQVTLLDAGLGSASRVPTALINPVRGYAGKLVAGGFAAARCTFDLIERLSAQGHAIAHGRGLWRPAPDAATVARWQAQLPADAPYAWRAVPDALGLREPWPQALYLPDSGWLDTSDLLCALLAASEATLVSGQVCAIDGQAASVVLHEGTRLSADVLLWCGGARGAALLDARARVFRPGSVLLTDTPLASQAVSYGLYCAPYGQGGMVGATSEPRCSQFALDDAPRAVARLSERARAMWRTEWQCTGEFRGVRLESPSRTPSITTLDGFGSRGYLLAPQAAQAWAKTLP